MLRKDHSQNKKPTIWQFQEAKAKLSKVMDLAQETGMQMIVRNRNEIYVVLSKEKYDNDLQPKTSLLEFFANSPCPEVELDITRSQDLPREVDL